MGSSRSDWGPGGRAGRSRGRLQGQPGGRAGGGSGASPAFAPLAPAAEPGGGVRLLPPVLGRGSAEPFRGRPSPRTGRDGRPSPPAGKGSPARRRRRPATSPPFAVAARLGGRPRSARRRRGGTRDPSGSRGAPSRKLAGGRPGPRRPLRAAWEGWLPPTARSAAPTEAAALRRPDICTAGPPRALSPRPGSAGGRRRRGLPGGLPGEGGSCAGGSPWTRPPEPAGLLGACKAPSRPGESGLPWREGRAARDVTGGWRSAHVEHGRARGGRPIGAFPTAHWPAWPLAATPPGRLSVKPTRAPAPAIGRCAVPGERPGSRSQSRAEWRAAAGWSGERGVAEDCGRRSLPGLTASKTPPRPSGSRGRRPCLRSRSDGRGRLPVPECAQHGEKFSVPCLG